MVYCFGSIVKTSFLLRLLRNLYLRFDNSKVSDLIEKSALINHFFSGVISLSNVNSVVNCIASALKCTILVKFL